VVWQFTTGVLWPGALHAHSCPEVLPRQHQTPWRPDVSLAYVIT